MSALDPFGLDKPAKPSPPLDPYTLEDALAEAEAAVKRTSDALDAAMNEAMRLKPAGDMFVPLRASHGDYTPGQYGVARRRALLAHEAALTAVDYRAKVRAALAKRGGSRC